MPLYVAQKVKESTNLGLFDRLKFRRSARFFCAFCDGGPIRGWDILPRVHERELSESI
jgi:hypothetical protein